MNDNFIRAFGEVIGVEGGYVNNPNDPGGETIYGITKRDHPEAWAQGRPTLEQARKIYEEKYWAPAKCDKLPWPLALFVFDGAVNQGPVISVKLLQKALGTAQDGIIGNNTMMAINRANQKELCAMFMADRALRYIGTRNFDMFGRGWFKRLFIVSMNGRDT